VRIHRSFLVQLSCVSDVRTAGSGRLTVVVDGHRLPVSRRRTEMVRSRLGHGR
jgi:DNA-binding LytR/AlgR family response regulator